MNRSENISKIERFFDYFMRIVIRLFNKNNMKIERFWSICRRFYYYQTVYNISGRLYILSGCITHRLHIIQSAVSLRLDRKLFQRQKCTTYLCTNPGRKFILLFSGNIRGKFVKCTLALGVTAGLFSGCSAIHARATKTAAPQKKEIHKVYNEIGDINAEIRSIYTTIGEFRAQTGEDFGKFYEEARSGQNEIRKKISAIQGDLGTYKVNQAELIEGIQVISDTLNQISANIEEYAYRVSSVAQRLDSIDTRITQLSDIYSDMSKHEIGQVKIKKLDKKGKTQQLSNMSSGIVDIQTDLALLKVKMLILQEDMASLVSALPVKKDGNKNKLPQSVIVPSYRNIPRLEAQTSLSVTSGNNFSESIPSSVKVQQKEGVPLLVSSGPKDIYEASKLDYLKGNFKLALSGFQNFIDKYPTAELAPNAQYWIGECYYSEGEYGKAIESFNKVFERYPKSSKIPSVMLKIAYAELKLKKRQEAVEHMNNLIAMYPGSDEAKLAADKIKRLDNNN